MKKIIIIVILIFSLFGCSKRDIKKLMNPDYEIELIANVQSIQLNGTGENGLKNVYDLINVAIYQHLVDRNETQEIDTKNVNWVVGGDTKDGVMILVTYKDCEVYLPIIENGDYISIDISEGYVKSPNIKQRLNKLYEEYKKIINKFKDKIKKYLKIGRK